MTIKEKITGLLKEKGTTIRDLAISIGTTEVGLHYMFKNNSFKFDTIEKTSKYFNVDISYFSDTPSNENRQFKPTKSNKIELQNPYETSIKAEKVKNSIIENAKAESYLHNLTLSVLIIELLSKYIYNGIFNKYKDLFNSMLIELDKGIETSIVVEKHSNELKDLVDNSAINEKTLSNIKNELLAIFVFIQNNSTEADIQNKINEIVEISKMKPKKRK
ncbi:MAG: hypothetical protein Q8K70_01830 [Bacteroidota bacterium]|nr:hypothetical protein [Bacteroidota bacterium]